MEKGCLLGFEANIKRCIINKRENNLDPQTMNMKSFKGLRVGLNDKR